MPRPPRVEVEDGIFHIATRAVFSQLAYLDTIDRLDFIDLLWRVVDVHKWQCQSYCLMGTHYHLIVQTPHANLAAGMQMLNGRYAQRFNWRHRPRHGHLFGRRFGSVRQESERQLLATHRYVARNPVRASLCKSPADWRWSSVRAIAGLATVPDFLDRNAVLALMGTPRELAPATFLEYVSEAAPGEEIVVEPMAPVDEAERVGV
jgi:putative transposase